MKISKDRLKKGRKPVKSKDKSTGIRVKTDTAEMDHTPNKQSKTDSTDRLPEDFTCAGASQRDVFDTEYERSNVGSQFESQSGYRGSVCNFPKKGSTSYSAASFSAVNFPSNRPTSTVTSCGSTMKQIRWVFDNLGIQFPHVSIKPCCGYSLELPRWSNF